MTFTTIASWQTPQKPTPVKATPAKTTPPRAVPIKPPRR